MIIAQEIEWIGHLIDEYAFSLPAQGRIGVASLTQTDRGVPPDMWVGEPNREGWVKWKVLPSTLTIADVSSLESDFGVLFPAPFRAYLMARFHCFKQVGSRQYNQAILFPDLLTRDPLRSIRSCLEGWKPLLRACLIPFAEWGDGWGPMCFDTARRSADGDCPILWLDHEQIIPLGAEQLGMRPRLTHFEQHIHGSFHELAEDVFEKQRKR